MGKIFSMVASFEERVRDCFYQVELADIEVVGELGSLSVTKGMQLSRACYYIKVFEDS